MPNPNHDQFQFCPFCGRQELQPASVKSFACRACGRPFFLNVAAAAAAVIRDPLGAMLVTVRKNDPAAGTWDLPGGFADPGETVEQSLRREVLEEVGFDPGTLAYHCSWPNQYAYKGVLYATLDLFYLAQLDTRPELKIGDEIAGAHWVPPDELDPSRFGLGSIRQVIQQLV